MLQYILSVKHQHNSLLHFIGKLHAYSIRPLSGHSQTIKIAYIKVKLKIATSVLGDCNL